MNRTNLLIVFFLIFNIAVPSQASTHTMAHIISSAKQGLKFCVGELKALTPTTLRAVAITAAVSSYLAMQLYEDANSDENNKSKMNEVIANKSKMQEIIANN